MSDLAPPANTSSAAGTPIRRSAESARATAQFGVIVFLASDIMLFAPFFAAYFLLRAGVDPWPPEGAELDTIRAALATAVLVASSFTLIASDRAAERAAGGPAVRRWLLVTIALGVLFLGNQIAEYAVLPFSAGDHTYGSVYWTLTGLHGLHVAAGVGAMALLFIRSARSRSMAATASWQGGVSLFWHLVDVIWLFVFATIWIMR